jgi:hypothetical protein
LQVETQDVVNKTLPIKTIKQKKFGPIAPPLKAYDKKID